MPIWPPGPGRRPPGARPTDPAGREPEPRAPVPIRALTAHWRLFALAAVVSFALCPLFGIWLGAAGTVAALVSAVRLGLGHRGALLWFVGSMGVITGVAFYVLLAGLLLGFGAPSSGGG